MTEMSLTRRIQTSDFNMLQVGPEDAYIHFIGNGKSGVHPDRPFSYLSKLNISYP